MVLALYSNANENHLHRVFQEVVLGFSTKHHQLYEEYHGQYKLGISSPFLIRATFIQNILLQ